jgi:hypothetical protein
MVQLQQLPIADPGHFLRHALNEATRPGGSRSLVPERPDHARPMLTDGDSYHKALLQKMGLPT